MPEFSLKNKSIHQIALLVVFIVVTLIGVNAISHGNYTGQDFQRHSQAIRLAAIDPWTTLTRPVAKGLCTPSLYHVLCAGIYKLSTEDTAWERIACVNLVVSLLTLGLLWGLIRQCIEDRVVALTCFIFIAFLPVVRVASIVIAPDAWMPFFILAMVYRVIRLTRLLVVGLWSWTEVVVINMLLFGACLIKFNTVFFWLGIVNLGMILYFNGKFHHQQVRRAVWSLMIIPGIVFFVIFVSYAWRQTSFYQNQSLANKDAGRMDVTKLVMVTAVDQELLKAPSFSEVIQAPPNRYSYPALLHLGIFTDVLNIFQPIHWPSGDIRVNDEYDTRIRLSHQQSLMHLAVVSGLVFSFGFLGAWIYYAGQLSKSLNLNISIIMVIATTFFACMTAMLPLTCWTYIQGFWLPRLIIPAVMLLPMLIFAALEVCYKRFEIDLRGIVLMLVIYQSVLHIQFLWVSSSPF